MRSWHLQFCLFLGVAFFGNAQGLRDSEVGVPRRRFLPWARLLPPVTGPRENAIIVVNTWPLTGPNGAAWKVLARKGTAVDAVVAGCSAAEEDRNITSVGYGGSPDERGNTTLDAMVMDGDTMKAGAVASMPYIKEATKVALGVMQMTRHTLLMGPAATNFAASLGFRRTDLSSNESRAMWKDWHDGHCQPNFRVPYQWTPDPRRSCGPYRKRRPRVTVDIAQERPNLDIKEDNHDTIGMIALDANGSMAVGMSTNGVKFRIPGRVGDTPIPGAGGFVDSKIGGAAGTGDGDVLMRFLLSFRAVELMRQGRNATEACQQSLRSVRQRGQRSGGLVALRADGQYGAACVGFESFALVVQTASTDGPEVIKVPCMKPWDT
uniref:Family T2 unassigned peptidase n=1 Tax=Spirometra erinaceieuropaei TaxID=99802 RepID=K7X7N7_SPIER|nr:family T2 unassigned peptidase [Spirometra erinaceieuropaei]